MYTRKERLLDTCALIDLVGLLPNLSFKPYTSGSIMKELARKKRNYEVGGFNRKTPQGLLLKAVSRVMAFYEANPDLVISDTSDSEVSGIMNLTSRQIAYEVYCSWGKVKPEDVDYVNLTRFGSKAGQILLTRLHEKGLFRDDLVDFIFRVALNTQRHVKSALDKCSVMSKPNFETDIAFLSTARTSPSFNSSRLEVVSNDADVREVLTFLPQPADREVRYLHGDSLAHSYR